MNNNGWKRVGAGQYQQGNGKVVNARTRANLPQGAAGNSRQPQAIQRPTPGNMPQMPQGFNPNQNFQPPQGYPPPGQQSQYPGQMGGQPMQDMMYRFPQGQGPNPQQMQQMYAGIQGGQGGGQASNSGYWRKTQQPAQPLGILGANPPQYNQG